MKKKSSTPDGQLLTRALTLLPANTLEVWAVLRKQDQDLSPSDVYRLLASDPRVKGVAMGATTRFSLATITSHR